MIRLALLALLLCSCATPGLVVGRHARSQQGYATYGAGQICEDAALVVEAADMAIPLLQAELRARWVDVAPLPKTGAAICKTRFAEGCGHGGTGAPRWDCQQYEVVRFPHWWPPLGQPGERSDDWRPRLIHGLAHLLQRRFDARHEDARVWGAGGAVARVTAAMVP